MKIQFNTGNNIVGSEAMSIPIVASLTEAMTRFSKYITRVEVHLSDEDGLKDGRNDKRCLIEVRLKGRQPIIVSNLANSQDEAVDGAIDKLKTLLDTILGRMKDNQRKKL
jgi:ribosome-associated translation inhibitor RaiA